MGLAYTIEPRLDFASAEGWHLHDRSGRLFVDLTSGWNVTNAGWNRAEIDVVWAKQGAASWFRPSWCDNSQLDALHQRMELIAPGRSIIPSCSGSEAIDNALKLARLVTGRAGVIRFEGAYHGSGTGASLATGYHVPHLDPLLPHAPVLDLPMPEEPGAVEVAEAAIRAFEEAGALVFETVLTNMACRELPKAYRAMLSRVCKELGIILIADEIGTGMNRLGAFFSTLDGVPDRDQPDIVVSAKALTNGLYPLSLCLVRERLAMQCDAGWFGSTYAAMPSACAAAVATIDIHLADGLSQRAAKTGTAFAQALRDQTAAVAGVTAVAGAGLELALHLDWKILKCQGLTPFTLLERLADLGLFATLSPSENHLMLMPPLVTPVDVLFGAAETIAGVLAKA